MTATGTWQVSMTATKVRTNGEIKMPLTRTFHDFIENCWDKKEENRVLSKPNPSAVSESLGKHDVASAIAVQLHPKAATIESNMKQGPYPNFRIEEHKLYNY